MATVVAMMHPTVDSLGRSSPIRKHRCATVSTFDSRPLQEHVDKKENVIELFGRLYLETTLNTDDCWFWNTHIHKNVESSCGCSSKQ
jgi:hypothetical protein